MTSPVPSAAGDTVTPMPRRRDGAETRAAVLAVARGLFATMPYADVTMKLIAAEAEVSPPLVIKYFGSKDQLFSEAADHRERFNQLLDAPLDQLGRHLVSALLPYTDGGGDPLLGLLFMAGKKDAPIDVRDAIRVQFIDALRERLDGQDAGLRAEVACAELVGFVAMRRVLRSPLLNAMSHDDAIRLYGERIQRLLDGR